MKMDIATLISRIERLTGPSRGVDVLLGYQADLRIDSMSVTFRQYVDLFDVGTVAKDAERSNSILRELPRYTDSVDAALALIGAIIPGWDYSIKMFNSDGLYVHFWECGCYNDHIAIHARHDTSPAIALVLGALKAKLAEEKER